MVIMFPVFPIYESGLLLRLEYITYHYVLARLEGIMNYCNASNGLVNDPNILKMLNSIDYSKLKVLRISAFRNCMMHFGLWSKEGQSLIDENVLDLSIPLCGLIETQFNMDYEQFKNKIEAELAQISDVLTNYLDFELLLNGKQ